MPEIIRLPEASSRPGKRKLAQHLTPLGSAPHFYCLYHGVPLRFAFDHRASLEFARGRLPMAWLREAEPALSLHWQDAHRLWTGGDVEFDEDPDPGFEVRGDMVLQRDFVARRLSPREAVIAAKADSSDGLFNALRWFLPPALLSRGALVAHSAAVIGNDGRAHVFLGHSGAGKSTIASFAGNRVVLGDDINLIRVGELGATVEPALLGQARFDRDRIDKPAPLAGFYWLRQSSEVQVRALGPGELARALVHTFLLSDSSLASALMERLVQLVRQVPGFELSFRRDADFWRVIDG